MHRDDFRHFISLTVQWGEMDTLRHVNNVQYFRYLESGRVAYIHEVLERTLEDPETMVLADVRCTFIQQLEYPATIQVASRISRLGKSSLDISNAIFREGETQPVATALCVVVWFDNLARRPAPFPAALRERVVAYEKISPAV